MGQKGHGTVHFQSHEIIGTSGRKSTSSDMYAFGMTIAQVGYLNICRFGPEA